LLIGGFLLCQTEKLAIVRQGLEGVIPLHATVTPLQQHLQGVSALAPSGDYRQQGEDA
jgi:hypothetical protein